MDLRRLLYVGLVVAQLSSSLLAQDAAKATSAPRIVEFEVIAVAASLNREDFDKFVSLDRNATAILQLLEELSDAGKLSTLQRFRVIIPEGQTAEVSSELCAGRTSHGAVTTASVSPTDAYGDRVRVHISVSMQRLKGSIPVQLTPFEDPQDRSKSSRDTGPGGSVTTVVELPYGQPRQLGGTASWSDGQVSGSISKFIMTARLRKASE